MVFNEIYKVEVPEKVFVGEGFTVFVFADGEIPFPQIIISQQEGNDWIVKDILVALEEPEFTASAFLLILIETVKLI